MTCRREELPNAGEFLPAGSSAVSVKSDLIREATRYEGADASGDSLMSNAFRVPGTISFNPHNSTTCVGTAAAPRVTTAGLRLQLECLSPAGINNQMWLT